MRLGGRVLAIFLAIAGLTIGAPTPARAAQNCALTRTGEVYCWGPVAPVRVQVTGRVVQLASAGDSTCALTEPGDVYCWPAGTDPEAEAAGDSPLGGLSPLLLITVGLLLVGAGVTLVLLSRPGENRPTGAHSA